MSYKILKYLLYAVFLSLILGPLGVIPLGIPQVNVYFTDIVIGLICLVWLVKAKVAIEFIKKDKIAKYFCFFVGIAVISLAFSPINLNFNERFISGLYIVRLFAYFFVYITVKYLTDSSTPGESFQAAPGVFLSLLKRVGVILAAVGWLQYFLYADLRNLYYLGWDPHFKRIFSTYLDPNYFGLVMVLTILPLISYNSPSSPSYFKRGLGGVTTIFLFLTLMFTYSRSSFLALIVSALYFFYEKRKYSWIGTLIIIMFITIILLPRPGGVGVQLERLFSIETRIENWQQAFKIFSDHPVLGVGFNTIRYTKIQYNLPQDNLAESHAGAGFDNSFLFIAVTTGMVGFLSYLFFLKKIWKKQNLLVRTSLAAIIIHSFFLNSLFFPWVMMWLWVVLGIKGNNLLDVRR